MADPRLEVAVRHFWSKRGSQAKEQLRRGSTDQGMRSSVTAGKQMDGFIGVVTDILLNAGARKDEIYVDSKLELPGYFRPEKKWDVVMVANQKLVAVIEFKSMASSFGNNLNNRVEEAVGSATDLWTAYREGAFPTAPRPWLGFMMLLVESEKSTQPVGVREPHFPVSPEYKGASYAERCQIMLEKLMRERLYDASAYLLTPESGGSSGQYSEPSTSLSFRFFEESLHAHISQFQRLRT